MIPTKHGEPVEEPSAEELDELIERESKRKKGVLRCPECGSPRLFYFLGFYAGQIYQCKDCGYRGPLVIEEEAKASKCRKKS